MGCAVPEYTNLPTSHRPVAFKYTFLSTTEINKQKNAYLDTVFIN
jgi:hypothetical protein